MENVSITQATVALSKTGKVVLQRIAEKLKNENNQSHCDHTEHTSHMNSPHFDTNYHTETSKKTLLEETISTLSKSDKNPLKRIVEKLKNENSDSLCDHTDFTSFSNSK
jgi:GTP-sensing pleiotropic transcriptional regulator CodY